MRETKSLWQSAGILFGGLGTMLCLAALLALCLASGRVQGATDRVFDVADRSLVAVRQRVVQTQQRVQTAAISTKEIEETLRDWSRREVGQRLAVRLDAANRTQRLAAGLEQADAWLEVARSSAGLVRELLSSDAVLSEPRDTTSLDGILQELGSLRAQLAEATSFVAGVQERIAALSDDSAPGERVQEAIALALRVVAAVSSIDSGIGQIAERLSLAQTNVQNAKVRMQRSILMVSIAGTLGILWMAAGQIALCRLAWKSRGPRPA